MRADRLISIVLLLQANGRMTAETLASRLEVSQRTILRDMDALSSAGVPVIAERGTGGGWRLIDGYETKLTGLTPAEIRSLFLARPPALLAELGIKEAADAAWLKLRAALPLGVREQAEFVRQRLLDRCARVARLCRVADELAHDPRGTVGRPPLEVPVRENRRRIERSRGRSARARRARQPLVSRRNERRRATDLPRVADPFGRDPGRAVHSARPTFDLAAYWEASTNRFREHLPRYDATFLVTPHILPWVCYRSWRVIEQDPGRRAIPRLATLRFGRRGAAICTCRSVPSSRSWSRRSSGSA